MVMTTVSLLVGLLAVIAGIFVHSNRMLFGLNTGPVNEKHASFIKPKDDVLNYYLEKHHKQIGADYVPYRNHCLRVLAFTRYFLSLDNIELEPRTFNIIAMALAYHDIALWTDGELNYLEPSVMQMRERVLEEMKQSNQAEVDEGTLFVPMQFHWSTFEEDSNIARTIILQHHKFTSYNHKDHYKSNNNQSDEDQNENPKKGLQEAAEPPIEHMNEIVNAVRKADWADATMGIIRFGLPQSILGAAYEAIPDEGFHNVLLEMGSRLQPNNLMGQLEVLKILRW